MNIKKIWSVKQNCHCYNNYYSFYDNKNSIINGTPVTSYGILAFIKNYKNDYNDETKENIKTIKNYNKGVDNPLQLQLHTQLRLLMVQRRNTMGFNDLIRGRHFFNNPVQIAKLYLTEMTHEERDLVKNKTFDELWNDLWLNKDSKYYKYDKLKAKNKYEKINVNSLLNKTSTIYSFPEYGIPKGHKNKKETELDCAKREFGEETGYSPDSYKIINIEPIVETFVGTNNIEYKHVYFLAIMNEEDIIPPKLDKNNSQQCEEIKNLDFFYQYDAIKILRDYDFEKKNILIKSFEKMKSIISKPNIEFYE